MLVRSGTACGWSLLASLGSTTPADAREPRVALDVQAGPLGDSIAVLARQSGTSIGSSERLPAEITPAVRGSMTVEAALNRLLRRSSWRAVRLAPDVFRLERRPRAPVLPSSSAMPAASPTGAGPPIGDIVVTATKRRETLADVAAPIAVDTGGMLGDDIGEDGGTRAVAQTLTGLFTTNLGPGRNRLFVRGTADSPFDGFGQAAVSVQVDEARATYDAPDPDVRLVDMAQVELLKGPQGPLYGTGALGGVYRLVPAKPDLDRFAGAISASGRVVSAGGAAGSADAMVNVPLIDGRLGIRAVGYRSGQGGWIDEVGTGRDVNHGATSGGRLALRARVGAAWTLDVSGLAQASSVADSQYVDGALGALTRPHRLPEPQDTDFSLVAATATGPIGSMIFTGSASIAMQELRATYNATLAAAGLGATGPASYLDDRRYQVVNAEARVAAGTGRFGWLAGASVLSAATDATGSITAATGTGDVLSFQRRVSEIALFGEGTRSVGERLSIEVGARLFRSQTHDERRERDRDNGASGATTRVSPSATLSWRLGRDAIVYARFASALRPGGVDASAAGGPASATAYSSDKLNSLDLGTRAPVGSALTFDADLFVTRWTGVQADYLDANGLVTTRNAGNADNLGLDASLRWKPDPAWTVTVGTVLQRARIDPNGNLETSADRRLPAVPDASANGEVARDLTAGRWKLHLLGRANYLGASRLSFDPTLDRRTPDSVILSTAVLADRGGWRLRVGADNLLDSHADTFAFGNPFSVRSGNQRTPTRPRTLSLTVKRGW